MDLFRWNRRVIEQTLSKMGEISIRVPQWRNAFVHLHNVNARPRELFICQGAQHDPGSMTAADSHHEAPPRRDCGAGLCSNGLRGRLRSGHIISEHFNLHREFSASELPVPQAAWPATDGASCPTIGFCQPPGGVTRSTSSGPQVLGEY